MAVQVDSVALAEAQVQEQPRCSSSPTRHAPACDRSWLPTAGVADPVATTASAMIAPRHMVADRKYPRKRRWSSMSHVVADHDGIACED
jgi:hypothetical protein